MRTILCIGLLAIAPAMWAEEFSTTPKQETLQEAIRFQKNKDAADAAQARKESGEQAQVSRKATSKAKTTTARTKSESDRKTGQADSKK